MKTVLHTHSNHGETPAFRAGVREKDRIIGIYNSRGEGGPIRGMNDWGRFLKKVGYDEPWTLEVLRGLESAPQIVRIQMPPTPSSLQNLKLWLFLVLLGIVAPFVRSCDGQDQRFLVSGIRWRFFFARILVVTIVKDCEFDPDIMMKPGAIPRCIKVIDCKPMHFYACIWKRSLQMSRRHWMYM